MSKIIARNFGTINAMANITTQTSSQRQKFFENNGFGSYQTNSIWVDLNINNEYNKKAFTKSIELYNKDVYTGTDEYYNPDFDSSLQLGYNSRPNYGSIADKRESLDDYPNIIGPNLKSGSFTTDDLPKFDNQNSFILYRDIADKIGKGGFGSHFKINTLMSVATLGSYLRRSASTEYVQEIDDNDRPVLGEYKEIEDIDY